jgi:hypothetical protein
VKLRDFYSDYYRTIGTVLGMQMGDGDPIAELIDAEGKAGRAAIAARALEGERSLQGEFNPDPMMRVRARAEAAFEKEMREINTTRVGDRPGTTAELSPLREQAQRRRDLTIQREQDRLDEEARKKREADLTESDRTRRERDERRRSEELSVLQAERGIDFLEKSAQASTMRAAGLEREAEALEILTQAEKDLIEIREDENLGAGSKRRGEAAIIAQARARLEGLGDGGGGPAIGGATLVAGTGSVLARQVFGTVGPSGNTDTRKIIDTAKAQLVELKGIRDAISRPQLAVFAP